MGTEYVLFGAGTTGRVIARDLNAKGIKFVFADNNQSKWGKLMEGATVLSPEGAKDRYPDATWLASAIVPDFWRQLMVDIEKMGVKTIPVWGFLPQRHTPPSRAVFDNLLRLVDDPVSLNFLWDQWHMRNDPANYVQCAPVDINEIYWPEFIVRRDDEHYVDCGAADGDTVTEFIKRWPNYRAITAFEPDWENFQKLSDKFPRGIDMCPTAISDFDGTALFVSTGDYSAHFGQGEKSVSCRKLDTWERFKAPPTYIKMDIEGSEPEAIWGARKTLKEHKPVLAICAYHEAEHLWELPLLIHALQPEYKLFFRRYAEGAFEIVWYAVPPDRVNQ